MNALKKSHKNISKLILSVLTLVTTNTLTAQYYEPAVIITEELHLHPVQFDPGSGYLQEVEEWIAYEEFNSHESKQMDKKRILEIESHIHPGDHGFNILEVGIKVNRPGKIIIRFISLEGAGLEIIAEGCVSRGEHFFEVRIHPDLRHYAIAVRAKREFKYKEFAM